MPSQPNSDLSKGFETETCGRCGGTGHHSFNQLDGTRCFGCSGYSGIILTKRGKAAREYFITSISVPVSEIQVGWKFQDSNKKWSTVTSISQSGSRYLDRESGEWIPYIDVVTGYGAMGCFPNSVVEAQPSMEAVQEKLFAALAYQQTLTQAGTVTKRKKVA